MTNTKMELKKQECIIAEGVGQCIVVLWESDIGKLTVNSSYCLRNWIVHMFDSKKYCQWTRQLKHLKISVKCLLMLIQLKQERS